MVPQWYYLLMSRTEKLKQKLQNGTITGPELETLLGKLGWTRSRTKGSHTTWTNGSANMTLVEGRKDLKPYQIKMAQQMLSKGDDHGKEE